MSVDAVLIRWGSGKSMARQTQASSLNSKLRVKVRKSSNQRESLARKLTCSYPSRKSNTDFAKPVSPNRRSYPTSPELLSGEERTHRRSSASDCTMTNRCPVTDTAFDLARNSDERHDVDTTPLPVRKNPRQQNSRENRHYSGITVDLSNAPTALMRCTIAPRPTPPYSGARRERAHSPPLTTGTAVRPP
jgi:hypothetical protein